MLRYFGYILLALLCLSDVVSNQCDECIKDEIKGIKAELKELQKALYAILGRIGKANIIVILEKIAYK